MYPNEENIVVMPITKRMGIIMSILVCLISRMNFDYKDNGEKKKLFLQIQSINIVYLNVENMLVVPITKRMEITIRIQVCLISQMNFDYEENEGKKSFSCKSKASISCIRMWGT